MDNSKIVAKILSACENGNIKIKTLLKEAGLSVRLSDDWAENKAEPSFSALIRICDCLGIGIEELFQGDEMSLTESQTKILEEWKAMSSRERTAIFHYIKAMKNSSGKK